jgi:hypothetical protein
VPHVFNQDRELFIDWKHILAKKLAVDTASVLLVGSGCVGMSLNPYKNYRLFTPSSDIDIALVSDYYFSVAWRSLRNLGSRIHSLLPKERQSVNDHVQKYIYWGTIATDHILPLFPFSKRWHEALQHMSSMHPTDGRHIKIRLYKDFESLRAYHINNFRELRDAVLGQGET